MVSSREGFTAFESFRIVLSYRREAKGTEKSHYLEYGVSALDPCTANSHETQGALDP